MARSGKDQNSSNSGPGSFARFERWQELRQNLEAGDLLRVRWSPNNPDSVGIRPDNQAVEDWHDWLDKELSKKMSMNDLNYYAKNRSRQNELIAYAKPYRFNIATDQYSYQLWLDDGATGKQSRRVVAREVIDSAQDPQSMIKGYIDEMRRELENPYVLSAQGVQELVEYARPFELLITENSTVGMDPMVNLSLKNVPEYGYKNTNVVIPYSARSPAGVIGVLKGHIDKMRSELGWKKEEDGMPIKPVRQGKFVLECPVHGGAMVPGGEKYLFICLVPGCTKRARRKHKHHVSGGMAEPLAPGTSAMTSGESTYLPMEPTSPGPNEGVFKKYYEAMKEPPWGKN